MNVRTRATLQIFRFLHGELPRIPPTAVEVYAELVDQLAKLLRVDLAAMLEKKVDHTQSTVEEMQSELLEVKEDLRYTNQLLELFY